mgnify:CR=1 FL=1
MEPVVTQREVATVDARGKPRVGTVNSLPSKTKQQDAAKADIQEILRKYEQVGIVPHLNEVDAKYLDVSEFTDYSDMMRQLRTAEREFMTLPAAVRALFKNDVADWLDAAHDPERIDELNRMLNPDDVVVDDPVPVPEAPVPPQSGEAE